MKRTHHIGTNINTFIEQGILWIKVDLRESHGLTLSGNSRIIGKTNSITNISPDSEITCQVSVLKPYEQPERF